VNLVFVLAIVAVGALMVVGGVMLSRLLTPRVPSKTKEQPYECGEIPVGSARVQFNVAYYLFALLFLVFDVEALFLYPWAVTLREAGFVGLIEILIFVAILVAGLAYAYKKGALEWHS
jgi:NADH-quinone oxidoreductase subunit A